MEMESDPSVKTLLEEWLNTIPDRLCFEEKMKVYAPTCGGDCTQEVDVLRDKINKIFGGCTVYEQSTGCWFDKENNKILCEPVKVLEVAHSCSDKDTLLKLANAIADYASKTKQHSISIHNGSFFIAETPKLIEKLQEEFVKV